MLRQLWMKHTQVVVEKCLHFFGWWISSLSGEYLLKVYPNGGTVVFLRSLHVALVLFAGAIGVGEILDPDAGRTFSWLETRIQTGSHITWFGAIFAGVYALLYARFSSQWAYLAGVYNQIKSAEARKDADEGALAEWKAGFIEDCQDLHLLRKPMFASVVHAWLNPERGLGVRECFSMYAPNGEKRLMEIERQLRKVMARAGSAAKNDVQSNKVNTEAGPQPGAARRAG
jgi:hypothetical protein